MKTSAHVDETGSVTSDDNSPSQDHTHPDDQNTLLNLVLFVLTHAFVFIVPCKQRKDFISRAIGHARRSEAAVSFGTKVPIVSFHHSLAFTFKNVFPCRITFDTFYKISLIKVFLRARKEIIEFEKVSDVNEV